MIRVTITVEESSDDEPRMRPTVASRQITYYETQPYTVKLETPDGIDWQQSLVAGSRSEA